MDVLVIGRNVEVLETVKGGLIARGVAADGTTNPERASIDFDARDFAVVAIGGGVSSPLRETLKSDFRRQNPDVILLDTFAPVAVSHITAALRGDVGRREFASRFDITEDDGPYVMHLELKKECDVCVEAYHSKSGIHGTTLGRGHLLYSKIMCWVAVDRALIQPRWAAQATTAGAVNDRSRPSDQHHAGRLQVCGIWGESVGLSSAGSLRPRKGNNKKSFLYRTRRCSALVAKTQQCEESNAHKSERGRLGS